MNAFRDTRVLTEAALAVALAFVLGFLRFFHMPYGGSVSLEAVPIVLLALRQGPWVGMTAGAVYGLLNLILDPVILHPVQVLLDYPVPFAVLGVAGFFPPTARGAVVGTVLAFLLRFVSHFTSGVVFFAAYAPENLSPVVYSAAYNASYLSVTLVISLVVVVALLKALEGAQPSPRQARLKRPAVR